MHNLKQSFLFRISVLIFFLSANNFTTFSQTTEGTEFWLSFMTNEKSPELSIMVSAKRACVLSIKNINTGYSASVNLTPGLNKIQSSLTPVSETYVTSSEVIEKKSLLISSTDTISLFASNYVAKVFDVAAILPTTALKDEYMIQTYKNSSQKQQYSPEFLIVATEDNTTIDITPTWITSMGKPANQPFTITLNKGESYQVQTEYSVLNSDLSGSIVKARDGKKIAVFNGNQSESIPYGGGNDGDHLFEQAMPVVYWGTKFVITESMNRAEDKVCITARNNDTSVRKNGVEIAVIKSGQTLELELLASEPSCYLETSCPCAVYLYLVSNHKYDTTDKLGGPSMIWINPIEQMIKDINFCTYETAYTSNHYINIVTQTTNISNVTLAGKSTGNKLLTFQPVTGNSNYSYARTTLADDSYLLKGSAGVIAHVYGLGENESYGYTVGGAVKWLEQYVLINGENYTPGSNVQLCSLDTIHYSCNMNFETENIIWNFGDGTPIVSGKNLTNIYHYYPNPGLYNAYLIIQRLSSNLCAGQLARDSISITVNIERIQINIDSVSKFICASEGTFKAYYSKQSAGTVTSAEVKFDNAAHNDGFTDNTINANDKYFEIHLPESAVPAKNYSAKIIVHGNCSEDTLNLNFVVNYPANRILTQRWNDVLSVKNASENGGYNFTGFQWYKNDILMTNETSSYIYLNKTDFNTTDIYYVKLKTADGKELCTCKKNLEDKSADENIFKFNNDIVIASTFAKISSQVKLNVTSAGKVYFKDLTGKTYSIANISETTDYVSTPNESGIFLMDVLLNNGERKTIKFNVIK